VDLTASIVMGAIESTKRKIMNRFDFLSEHTVDLEEVDRIGDREFYIENFISERAINVLWAPGGEGKTWLVFALAKYFAHMGIHSIIIDTDNGVQLLKDRGYDVMLKEYKNWIQYINADSMDNPREDVQKILKQMHASAEGNFYEKTVVFMDSLKFFLGGGVYDETKLYNFFVGCKKIRRAGGTVIALNHALKKGGVMKGGATITDSGDEVWGFKNLFENDDELHCMLTPVKNRIGTKEVAFTIMTKTLELLPLDPVVASMSEEERAFVKSVQALLEKDVMMQGDILEAVGSYKADKTRLGWLEKHDKRYWIISKKGRSKQYEKIATTKETLQQ